MFDAWTLAGVGGGALALNYLAAGRKVGGSDAVSLRLTLAKDGSLLSDVRVLGGLLAFGASMYCHGTTRKALQVIAGASAVSVLTTEAIRFQLGRSGNRVAGALPVFPSFGATGATGAKSYQRQGAGWANG